ncbi:Glycerol-3-phosphate phosphatase [Cryptotermes secundus]|uniref:Glycerol-3-phosphate phosphatase n=1 Tax=Cryptotermes secundus TaxID=105785 RepID=A0A2J7Q0W5_9NEOP|nr:glycerol-3-phosphate phosphatase [Cryptotermes secundus]XP_023718671.1 glycerol-3-phosphate phosphatase [Cryptotermes secundus]XP_033609780.1 glycerol-3-phosphate phosphatase [Cryptotermes secundus]PNF22242.1 Glycerol-3-phosphate phosphatase [Cryptotermes secundus]PNF22243.1 Glycerol-3-phosphate phosphatase [Cryptotermes secundus]
MTQYLRDLSDFRKEEMDDFLASFDTVLTDCDGVLWFENTPLEGSVEVINRLKELGKKVFLVTNNCNSTVNQYMNKINTFGLHVAEDEIIFPSLVAASYFREQNFRKKAYILASSAFKEIFESNGIICSSDVGPDHAVKTIRDLANELQDLDEEVGAVVIDFDMNINFIKMMKAVFHLKNPDCLFVAGGVDVRVPSQSGLSILGPGCFISPIEEVSGRKALVTGKPSVLVKEFISKIHPIKPERTLMIGDMISTDMQLGTNCGFQKLLVLSGGTKFEDLKEDNTNLPHYYLKTLGDLLPLLPII